MKKTILCFFALSLLSIHIPAQKPINFKNTHVYQFKNALIHLKNDFIWDTDTGMHYAPFPIRFAFGGITVLISLFILLSIYRVRIREIKQKNAGLQLEMRSIRSQLNPHFIFNALSSIQGLINKNDISAANHYLTEFSSLLRETLVNNDRELVPLQTELKILETYLKLEQLRFHFQYEFLIDKSLNKDATEIPSLLVQPLVENAIKHGAAALHEKGMVGISIQTNQKNLLVSISDNGNGFTEANGTNGLGLKLTNDRIGLLNKTLKGQSIELTIESGQNKGTTVHLSFKNWL